MSVILFLNIQEGFSRTFSWNLSVLTNSPYLFVPLSSFSGVLSHDLLFLCNFGLCRRSKVRSERGKNSVSAKKIFQNIIYSEFRNE